MKAGGFIFVTGQVGAVDGQSKPITGAEAQTRQTLKNMKTVLETAGASLDDVIKTTVFLVKADDFAVMNKAYVEYFNKDVKPARSTVIVAALAKPEWIVEIECVAYHP
jgi:2-iminobutanoate/2-iminopropanoate deaminase